MKAVRSRRVWLGSFGALAMLVACGARTSVVGGAFESGGSAGASSGATKVTVASTGTVVSSGTEAVVTADTAEAGPASCSISASSYDQSCTGDGDCVAVGVGDGCDPDFCISCGNAAINVGALARYKVDVAATPAGRANNVCFCRFDANLSCCQAGQCTQACPSVVVTSGSTSASSGAVASSGGLVSSGAAATSGDTTSAIPPPTTAAPSCSGVGPGSSDCGPSKESCCTSLAAPGGTFLRDDDSLMTLAPSGTAVLSTMRIDKYEITVARFRNFVDAVVMNGWMPATGSGKHTYLHSGLGLSTSSAPAPVEQGWDGEWDANLASTSGGWDMNLECDTSLATWSRTSNDNEPINCITWYEAYAFCIWDGGFLPSDAELNYVESGGAEERVYPWSVPPTATTIDCSYATYLGCLSSAGGTNVVGSKSPKGDGKWGHADLGGNVWEWVLDMGSNGDCSDCADIGALPPPGSPFGVTRVMRGGGLGGSSTLEVASENSSAPEMRSAQQGARCGRAP